MSKENEVVKEKEGVALRETVLLVYVGRSGKIFGAI